MSPGFDSSVTHSARKYLSSREQNLWHIPQTEMCSVEAISVILFLPEFYLVPLSYPAGIMFVFKWMQKGLCIKAYNKNASELHRILF